jgi:hypothetical protein
MSSRIGTALLLAVPFGLMAQYHETTYSFKGVLKLGGKDIEITKLKVSNDEGRGSYYVRELRDFQNADKNRLPMASVSEIDFVAMNPDEEKVACSANGSEYVIPCLFRKANIKLRDGKQMKGVYFRVHGLTAYSRDGMPIEFNNREYKVFSLVGEAFDPVSH